MATVLSLPEPNNHAAFAHPNVTLDTAELERDPTNWPRFPSQNPRLSSPHVVPRYLFRVSTPSSSGSTTTTRIQSAYSLKYPDRIPKNFLDLDSSEAAVLLNTHLRWWTEFPDDFPQTNLVSWTSDLLFAVILAIRHTKSITIRTKPLKVSSVTQPERVCILMVDTKGIEDRFVDAHKLTEHTKGQCGAADPKIRAKLEKLVDWRRGDYKMAEFLSQGCLDVDGRCVSTTLADITNAGLFKIYNDLERPWEQGPWPEDVMRRLVKAREEFLMTRPTLAKDVALAVKIGRCFGGVSGNWALYVALMVLGFAERAEPQAESVCEGLREMVDEVPDINEFSPDNLRITECTSLPNELRRANDLVKKLYEYYSRREVVANEPDDLVQAMDSLALGYMSIHEDAEQKEAAEEIAEGEKGEQGEGCEHGAG